MSTNRVDLLSVNAAEALLRAYGVQVTDAELSKLMRICNYRERMLSRLAVILNNFADSQVSHINGPGVLEAVINKLLSSEEPLLALPFYGEGYVKLGLKIADFRLGLRLSSAFEQVYFSALPEPKIADSPESGFLPIKHDRALFLTELGELKQAETILRELAFVPQSYYYLNGEDKSLYQHIARQNLGDVLVLAGKLREAEQIADGMIQAYESDLINSSGSTQAEALIARLILGEKAYSPYRSGSNPYARRAVALSLQGKVCQALADFKRAEAFSLKKPRIYIYKFLAIKRLEKLGQPIPKAWEKSEPEHRTLVGQAAIFYALLLTRLGKLDSALKVLNYSKRWAAHRSNDWPSVVVYAELALSDVYRLRGEYSLAQHNLEHPLQWATQTGQQETYCWAHLSCSRLKHAQNQLPEAQNAVDKAYSVATRHGFKLYEIDCLVTAGWIALSHQDLVTAEQKAAAALKLVGDPDMAYAWGYGNTIHLMGEILFRKDDINKAHQFLTCAAKLREQIKDPRLKNTQELLDGIKHRLDRE